MPVFLVHTPTIPAHRETLFRPNKCHKVKEKENTFLASTSEVALKSSDLELTHVYQKYSCCTSCPWIHMDFTTRGANQRSALQSLTSEELLEKVTWHCRERERERVKLKLQPLLHHVNHQAAGRVTQQLSVFHWIISFSFVPTAPEPQEPRSGSRTIMISWVLLVSLICVSGQVSSGPGDGECCICWPPVTLACGVHIRH